MDKRTILANYAYTYAGDWNRIANALRIHAVPKVYTIKENYITIYDEVYPKQLASLRYPPWILFYRGDLSLLKRPMITIIGSRQLSAYGMENTRTAAQILSQDFVIVSGLAKGADGLAHRTARLKGHTIGVIGNGLDVQYPSCNRDLYLAMAKEDLILSEYPCYVTPERRHFPWRNRILAALGESCIVTQAARASGTMLTVNEALTLSKDIWCFPYPFQDETGDGCNLLIEQGAGILHTREQLLDFIPKERISKSIQLTL